MESMRRWPSPSVSDVKGTTEFHLRKDAKPETNHAVTLAQKVQWMSSAAVSPARTSVSPEKAQALRASAAAYGRNTPELLAKYDPDTSSWRTSQLCLDGDLALFSETWPRSGTMRNGTAYLLPPLVRLTDETGCGSLPTPTADAAIDAMPSPVMAERFRRKGSSGSFVEAMSSVMWPTPQARDSHNRSGQAHRYEEEKRWNLQDCLVSRGQSGSLNPTFVEWLMGFPRDWTEV
jgi:hypothetical protein